MQLTRILLALPALSLALAASEPPLLEAARTGDTSAVRKLSAIRSSLEVRGTHKQTALHDAASACSLPSAQILVEAGLDRLVRDDRGQTAHSIATKCPPSADRDRLVRLLVPAVPTSAQETAPWSLHDAAARGNAEVVRMLLKLGSNVNAIGNKGNRPLEIACRNGHAQVVRLLLEHGADIRLKTTAGTTVLHEAALGGSSDVIAVLLEGGAELQAGDENCSTPLHYAAGFGRLSAVQALVQRGANTGTKNSKGATPLDEAKANDQREVAEWLQQQTRRP